MTDITTTTGIDTQRFSEQIRAATWGDHRNAESSSAMDRLMAGTLPRADYAEMVAQLWFVYRDLEAAAAAMADHPDAGGFVDPALTRLPALESDLDVVAGDRWRESIRPTAATSTYTDAIRANCFDWAGGFIAHHYTRYMGDLSGGQYIAKVAAKNYDLTPEAGIAFYRFDGIGDLDAYKQAYRARLDGLGWDATERQRVIDEIHAAYQYNSALLSAL